MDLSSHRQNYVKGELTEDKVSPDPFLQFASWFAEVSTAGILEPNAMVLATVDKDARPSARIVLLKSFDQEGFIFYTNYNSHKGQDIAANQNGALLFYWDKLEQQVRIEGTFEKVSEETSEKYFNSRPLESRLSAIVSEQSEEVASRQVLEDKLEQLRNTGNTRRPDDWGGYILKPTYFEFWQGRANRLHDRIVYVNDNGSWQIKRLQP